MLGEIFEIKLLLCNLFTGYLMSMFLFSFFQILINVIKVDLNVQRTQPARTWTGHSIVFAILVSSRMGATFAVSVSGFYFLILIKYFYEKASTMNQPHCFLS